MKNPGIAGTILQAMMTFVICGAMGAHADTVSDAPSTSDLNGLATFSSPETGALTVTFYNQSPGSPSRYNAATIVASTSSGDPAFAGNYTESGAESVSFNIRAETTVTEAVDVRLVLRSRISGRVWRNESVTASVQAGVTVTNEVSFERSSGWARDGGGDLDAMWAEDIESVEVIGVRLAQPEREGMSYTVSDFTITGDSFGSTPATLTALQQALKDKFGVTTPDALSDEEKALDFDVDTMESWRVLLSESDDAYANSIFMAQIIDVSGAGVRIRWPTVAGSSYTVIRSASLLDEFVDLQGATNRLSTTTGFMEHLDTTGFDDGPFFYKIRREKP